jgi:hypothetical protein
MKSVNKKTPLWDFYSNSTKSLYIYLPLEDSEIVLGLERNKGLISTCSWPFYRYFDVYFPKSRRPFGQLQVANFWNRPLANFDKWPLFSSVGFYVCYHFTSGTLYVLCKSVTNCEYSSHCRVKCDAV